jgi:hypothetical protein
VISRVTTDWRGSRADRGRDSDGLEGMIGAAPGGKRTDTGGAVGRGRIKGCVSAEFHGGVPARRVNVQGDEDAGRTRAEELDEQEPDESGSNHDDGIAEGDRRDGNSVGGDGGRFHERCVNEIESFGHGIDYPLLHDHIFGEGAGTAVFGA